MLAPFWGKNPEDQADPSSGRFDRYVEVGPALVEPVALESADLAVFPCEWSRSLAPAAETFVADALEVGLTDSDLRGGRRSRNSEL